MPKWLQFSAGVIGLGLALGVTAYVAGFTFLALNQTDPTSATPLTFYQYWYYYQGDPAQKPRLSLALLMGLSAGLGVPAALYASTRKKPSLHGAARFATAAEIKAAGLFAEQGVIVGKLGRRYLVFGGTQFILLAAPTRSGKGVSFVIPNMLTYADSAVVVDIKQEIFQLTSKYRQQHGQQVFLFNPLAEDLRTHRYNPLDFIQRDPNFRVGDIMSIGHALYPTLDKEPFWNDQARNLFLGLVLYMLETPQRPCTIGEAYRLSSGNGLPITDYMQQLITARQSGGQPLSPGCVDALNRFLHNSSDTLQGIMSSFNAPLLLWSNPIVDAATSASDFDLRALRQQRMTLYVGIKANRLDQAGVLANILFSQIVTLNMDQMPQENPALKYQCMLLFDELTAIGKINIIAKAIAFMAGYNLRLVTSIQSGEQLAETYTPTTARILAINHALHIYFTPRDDKDAKSYSEMLCYHDHAAVSAGSSHSYGINKGGSSRSENVSQQKRALMLPQEIKEIPHDRQIISLEYTKPILAERAAYYTDPVFIDRLKQCSPSLAALGKKLPTQAQLEQAVRQGELAIEVPLLNMDLHQAKVEQRIRDVNQLDIAHGLDPATLAHDFAHLPALDDKDHPSDASIEQFVEGFFQELNQGQARPAATAAATDPAAGDRLTPAAIANATEFAIHRVEVAALPT
jgi:type IV secretion system protein VirD4